jgi:hypothetical protein
MKSKLCRRAWDDLSLAGKCFLFWAMPIVFVLGLFIKEDSYQ